MDYKAIMEYFDEHPDEFVRAVEELDDIIGILKDDRCYDMCLLGHDEDEIVEEDGEKRFAPFNTKRKYFYCGTTSGLISTDHTVYDDYLNDFTIARMGALVGDMESIRGNEELKKLFNE